MLELESEIWLVKFNWMSPIKRQKLQLIKRRQQMIEKTQRLSLYVK